MTEDMHGNHWYIQTGGRPMSRAFPLDEALQEAEDDNRKLRERLQRITELIKSGDTYYEPDLTTPEGISFDSYWASIVRSVQKNRFIDWTEEG
tara:strand:- start:1124 stop:1402 length:279 start_codon:yes stop_codon:yes gene_type:complete